MNTLDVLQGLLADPSSDLPSLGELVSPKPFRGDGRELYESLSDLASSVEDEEYSAAEQGAFMQFHKMETLVESIADKSSKKRCALVVGNPGIGKCLGYDTSVSIRMPKAEAEKFLAFLSKTFEKEPYRQLS